MRISIELAAANKLRVGGICRWPNISARERKQRLWSAIYTNELTQGTQFIVTKPDQRLYTILGVTNEILPLPPHGRGGDRVFGYLYEMYGLDRMDPNARAVYEQFRLTAINEGIHAELRRFSAYDAESKSVYLSSYNGKMLRITGAGLPDEIASGEDGVFFIDDDRGVPITPDISNHGMLLDTLTNLNYEVGPGGITADIQRRFMTVWLFAQAFPDLIPDKPVMLLEGLKGSGKTSSVLLAQLALMGSHRVMSVSQDQEKDFSVLLLRAPIAVLDNVDSFIDWIQDKICQYATQGTFPKRRLFSDDEEILIKPHSFVAITSRNPASFRREDVVDRLLIIRLKRFESFTRSEKLMAFIRDNRAKLLGEYIWHVDRIVAAIRAGAIEEERVEQWRMASFASFTRLIGKVFEWSNEDVEEMLSAMQIERDIFEGEGDPLVEIMQEWLNYRVRGGPSNVGREFALTELFKCFSTIAKSKEIPFYKHHNRLADRLASSYVSHHFRIEIRHEDKTGMKFYRVWRHTDAQLSSISDDQISLIAPSQDDKPIPKLRVIFKPG